MSWEECVGGGGGGVDAAAAAAAAVVVVSAVVVVVDPALLDHLDCMLNRFGKAYDHYWMSMVIPCD